MIIPRDVSIAVCVILCESGTDLKYLPLITENKNTGLGLGGWGGLGVNCQLNWIPTSSTQSSPLVDLSGAKLRFSFYIFLPDQWCDGTGGTWRQQLRHFHHLLINYLTEAYVDMVDEDRTLNR